jgi:uncharacterized SAM-binding protein YcdF (DUF218 family)
MTRLVAVLGYSTRGSGELHPICSVRLARALQEAGPQDAVLLSGWGEAEAMARLWADRPAHVVLDHVVLDRRARSTFGNAVAVARTARSLGIRDVVVVTSSWHGRRAGALVRAALRGTDTTVSVVAAGDLGSLRARLRELLCWLFVPVQAGLATRRRS